MEVTTVFALERCPRCKGEPHLIREPRFQVRCECGVCGPQMRSSAEAARRWQSVVYYMRQHKDHVGETLQLASVEGMRPRPPFFSLKVRH